MSIELLSRSQLCCGLSDEQMRAVAEALRSVKYASGQVVFRQDEPGNSLFIVARGRVRIDVNQGNGRERFVDHLDVGEHFGEMAMLTEGRRSATVTAVTDSELVELQQQDFQRLLLTVPALAVNICRTMGYQLRRRTAGRPRRAKPKVVGLIHSSPSTREFLPRLAGALVESGVRLAALSECENEPTTSGPIERIPEELCGLDQVWWLQQRLSQLAPHCDQILLDLAAQPATARLKAALAHCEQVLWLVETETPDVALDQLRALLNAEPNLAPRVHLAWIIRDGSASLPSVLLERGVAQPDFKVVLEQHRGSDSRPARQSLSRVVRHLSGTRIGLALGGGGARGLAHLGVLRALEREGIDFDLVAGTSIGALMALPYAFGWELDRAVETFQRDLTPSWLFRHLPRGKQWYLVFKFRTGAWEPMLRRHFGDVRLEQLQIPLSTVSVDLIRGRQVVRDQGDAVNAVLESINLPGISRPILRDGMALVDGGVFNNIPVELLPERGADVVIGIDISASLSHRFGGNTPTTEPSRMRRPGIVETFLRANEVQDYEMTALRTRSVDLMMTVDTSAYEFADFTKASELAAIGERTAEAMMPQLKQFLAQQRESNSSSDSRFVCTPEICTPTAHQP